MNHLKSIKKSINKPGLCLDFQQAYEDIDIEDMESGERMEQDGMPVIGKPGLTIDGDVATIKVRGILAPDVGFDASYYGYTGYDVIEHYINVANNDNAVTQIILDIDSPGGAAKGCAEAGMAISNSEKPIKAFVSGDAYSAGYWLASSSKTITAKSSSGIGSIGAVLQHFDVSENLKNRGIKVSSFTSGFWKDAFSGSKPLSNRAKERLQQNINQLSQAFFEHVASHRNLTVKSIKDLDADCFDAENALNIGLIDAVQTASGTKVATNANANANSPTEPKPTQSTKKQNQPLISEEDEMAATEKELAQARAEARAEALAEVEGLAKAKTERLKQIYALEADDKVKEKLASDGFADVSVEDMQALVNAMPKGFNQIMDDEKGAGVEMNPTEFAEKPDAVVAAEAKKESAAEMQKINMKGVL